MSVLGYCELEYLSESNRRRPEAEVRNIQVAVGPQRHCRGQKEAGSNLNHLVLRNDSYDPSRARSREGVPGGVLQYVEPTLGVEGQSQDGGKPKYAVVRFPVGVIFMIFDDPSLMGNVSRLPTKKFSPS